MKKLNCGDDSSSESECCEYKIIEESDSDEECCHHESKQTITISVNELPKTISYPFKRVLPTMYCTTNPASLMNKTVVVGDSSKVEELEAKLKELEKKVGSGGSGNNMVVTN
jgi:hypothetical protein